MSFSFPCMFHHRSALPVSFLLTRYALYQEASHRQGRHRMESWRRCPRLLPYPPRETGCRRRGFVGRLGFISFFGCASTLSGASTLSEARSVSTSVAFSKAGSNASASRVSPSSRSSSSSPVVSPVNHFLSTSNALQILSIVLVHYTELTEGLTCRAIFQNVKFLRIPAFRNTAFISIPP